MKQPLFGQDSSPHITSMLISSIATLICWIIFCVLCFVVKFKPAVPEYKEIQIVLSSTPTEQKVAEEQSTVQESAAAAFENASAVPVNQTAVAEALEAPAVEKTTTPELPKPVETPKETPAPAKTQTTATKTQTTPTKKETPADKKVSYELVKSVEEQMAEQMSAKKTTTVPDWWNDDTSETEQQTAVTQTPGKVTTQSGMTGSAGQTTTQQTQTKTSSQNKAQDTTPAVSGSTSDALKSIQNTTGAPVSGGSATGSSDVQKFSSDLDITWNGGAARKAKGSLSINLTTGSSIKEKKTTVKIEFIVGEDGYVTPGSVKITPESLLPEEVRKEVISQINLWRFNEGVSRSIATFEYTIIKND